VVKALAVPDKLRGTASAAEAAAAICAGARAAGWECDALPMADGGEGTLDALGGPNRTTLVSGPLGDDVEARWRYGRTAVIEMAQASGLLLVGDGNDPVAASTAGTGELIATAIDAGCRRIIVGVGGSATTDGGLGALRALEPLSRLKGIELIVACDVRTTFVDAARIFSPQKGATPAQVELLHRRLERLAQVYAESYDVDVDAVPGSGAAGGLAGGLLCAGARLVSGFDVVAEELDLEGRLEGVDLLITGEGFLDEQSFEGKVVGGVAELGATNAVPVLAVVGEVLEGVAIPAGLETLSLVAECGEARARADAPGCIAEQVASRLQRWFAG
jgi:glycerate kinase